MYNELFTVKDDLKKSGEGADFTGRDQSAQS